MVDAESLRPSKIRRLMVAFARATALFILVAGIYGVAAIALPQTPVLNRSVGALLIGVIIFEMLRPPRRVVHVPADAPPAVDNSMELAEAQQAAEHLRAEVESARRREAGAREQFEREGEQLQRAATRALEELQKIRASHDELRAQLESERTRAAGLENVKAEAERRVAASAGELAAVSTDRQRARREIEETKQRAEVEKAAQRKTLEAEWGSKLKELQRELELTRSSAQQFLNSNEALKQQLDEERQRLHAELQRIIEESKTERDEMQAEARAVAARLDELSSNRARLEEDVELLRAAAASRDKELADSIATFETARAESQSFRQRIAELERERAMLHQQAEQRERDHEATLQRMDGEWGEKLQKIVNGLTTDHENDLGDAISDREAARAEVRSLNLRLSRLEHDNEMLKEQLEARAVPAIDEKSLREAIDLEWSAKLQKIVNELTSDHENDLGDAIGDREAARAEVRSLNLRVAKLEEDKAMLKEQLASRVAPAVDEQALREKIDAEWSAKLQTIVSHIASDHESDIGKAIEEREAARAEVRNLNIKMTALQQKVDNERRAREALQVRFREAEEQMRNAPTQPMMALIEPLTPPAPPPPPEEEQQARANVLEFAEQASEAIRRATSPGTVPLPVAEKKARILFVHHDPALRSMWRETLGKNGFEMFTAADGLEGLRIIKAERPDVVIADVSMPKMDGRELCQLIKSNPETAGVKVVLLTGVYTTEVPLDTATKQYEADELLRKPVKPDAMKAAIANLLAARAAS